MQITVCDFCDERVDKPIEVAEVFTPDDRSEFRTTCRYHELCESCANELEEHKTKMDAWSIDRMKVFRDVPGTITYERGDVIPVQETTKEKQEAK